MGLKIQHRANAHRREAQRSWSFAPMGVGTVAVAGSAAAGCSAALPLGDWYD